MQSASLTSLLLDPDALIQKSDLKPGQVVADFGCGNVGHVILPAARKVGEEGAAYAIDIQKRVISAIESIRRHEGLANLISLWGDFERPKGVRVPDQIFDVSFLVNNFSLAQKKDVMAEEIRRTTKKDGRLIVVDWDKDSLIFGQASVSTASPDEATALLQNHGFVFDHQFEAGPHSWGLVFRRAT